MLSRELHFCSPLSQLEIASTMKSAKLLSSTTFLILVSTFKILHYFNTELVLTTYNAPTSVFHMNNNYILKFLKTFCLVREEKCLLSFPKGLHIRNVQGIQMCIKRLKRKKLNDNKIE